MSNETIDGPELVRLYNALLKEHSELRAALAQAEQKLARIENQFVLDMVCEAHPWLEWPHDDCLGPGMPARNALEEFATLRTRLAEAEQERDAFRAIKERAEHELYVAGCVDDGISPTMRLLWRILAIKAVDKSPDAYDSVTQHHTL